MHDKPLISFAAAAALCGLSESTLRRLDRAGAMPGVVVHIPSARAYVRRTALLAWLAGEQAHEQKEQKLLKLLSS